MESFNKIDIVQNYCYKILPLVYDDSLSYYEVLCKVKSALNEVIENVNNLPDYIADLIEQFITSGAIDEVIREIIANYILNVKYPPKGITPAVGDGTADDTEAIQGCIDYAKANGYGAVYFPYGKYLTRPINLKSAVGLYGFDRYATSITCKSGATAPLFSGTVENVTIANLTLDGNDGNQVNDINLLDATVSNMLLTNLIFKDSNKHIVINGNGGHLQANNLIFNGCVINALTVRGNIDVMANNMIINSVSSVRGESAIEIGSSGGTWDFISKATVPTGLILGGSNNNINATIINAITPVTDSGANNNVVINGVSSSKHYTGNVTDVIGGNKNETISGNVTRSILQSVVNTITGNLTNNVGGAVTDTITGNKIENITGDKNVEATNSTETVSGNKTLTAANKIENITADKNVTVTNSTETVSGDKTITAKTITETTENYTINTTEDYTEDIKGNKITKITGSDNVTSNASSEKITTDKTIEAENIKLMPNNPLMYSEPVAGEYFDTIPMLSKNNAPYDLLVQNANTANIINDLGKWEHYSSLNGLININPAVFPTFVGDVYLNRKLGLMNISFILNTNELTGKPLNGNVPLFKIPVKIRSNVVYGEYALLSMDMYNSNKDITYNAKTGALFISDSDGYPTINAIMEGYGNAGFKTLAISCNTTFYVGDWEFENRPGLIKGWKTIPPERLVNVDTVTFPVSVCEGYINEELGLFNLSFILNTTLATGKNLNGFIKLIELPFVMPENTSYPIYIGNTLDMYNGNAGKEFNYFALTGAEIKTIDNKVYWTALMNEFGNNNLFTCAIVANVTIPIAYMNLTYVE